jgi:RNA-directed DNA polymerase
LLANIYLNELDWFIHQKWMGLEAKVRVGRRYHKTAVPCHITRYADDFVVMVKGTCEQAEQLKAEIAEFLQQELHLELSAEKTVITPVETGFDFLGFTIRKYSKVTLITPSKKAVQRFKDKVTEVAWQTFNMDEVTAIIFLNRIITGWGMYYRRVSSARTFRKLDQFIWWRVFRTAYRLHHRRGEKFAQFAVRHRVAYRFDINAKNRERAGAHFGVWADGEHQQAYLITGLRFIPIRYVQLHPQLNPYHPDERAKLESLRGLNEHLAELEQDALKITDEYGPEWNVIRSAVLAEAGYKCERCGRSVQGQTAHVHHVIPLKRSKSRQQANLRENLVCLCPSCHAHIERDSQKARA